MNISSDRVEMVDASPKVPMAIMPLRRSLGRGSSELLAYRGCCVISIFVDLRVKRLAGFGRSGIIEAEDEPSRNGSSTVAVGLEPVDHVEKCLEVSDI